MKYGVYNDSDRLVAMFAYRADAEMFLNYIDSDRGRGYRVETI